MNTIERLFYRPDERVKQALLAQAAPTKTTWAQHLMRLMITLAVAFGVPSTFVLALSGDNNPPEETTSPIKSARPGPIIVIIPPPLFTPTPQPVSSLPPPLNPEGIFHFPSKAQTGKRMAFEISVPGDIAAAPEVTCAETWHNPITFQRVTGRCSAVKIDPLSRQYDGQADRTIFSGAFIAGDGATGKNLIFSVRLPTQNGQRITKSFPCQLRRGE